MELDLQIETQKQMMRTDARSRRRSITADAMEDAATRVAGMDLGFLDSSPKILGAYFPVRSEFDCLPLLRRMADGGWRIALPVVKPNVPLEYHEWKFGAPMENGPFGIPEPVDGELLLPTAVLIPLLAFDRQCFRLGYGGGHYDRTLEALRAQHKVIAIGLAFDIQEVAEVPVCSYDQQLDWILTPSGAIPAKQTA
ncbi:MAG: 5-formyltetrahydrofolate cyclo-ligase [Hyphomicrobiales bacterium]|nr:5-formyltetrahydrofolate cyclo-ligase [Hyphomicrobiales bacterium]